MRLRDEIAKITKIKKEKIPGSYQIVGDILLVKFLKPLTDTGKKKIGKAILKLLPHVKSVWEIKQIVGEYRKPKVTFLIGDKKSVTVHKEHGIFYKVDVTKVMFSKGNLYERRRIVEKVKRGEVIVDMFAGIGYFSLGIAKFTEARKIYAIEKNRETFKFLKENIFLNEVKNIEPILGDCRDVAMYKDMQNITDRIIMGYLPNTYRFIPAALKFAKKKTIIHYHDTFSEDELWNKPIAVLEKFCKKYGYFVKVLEKRKVKSYAPKVWHVVLDVQVRKL